MNPSRCSRRSFAGTLLLAAFAPWARAAEENRALDLEIDAKSFGAGENDIRKVLLSAAGEIWKHCPQTRFEFGFRIYHHDQYPITHWEHEGGRVVIGLDTGETYWSQYAYQFAHEFCHVLMDHSNDWRRLWHSADHANKWLEETFCEVGSLFALRAMAKTWETAPPYPHWASYAPKLGRYATDRMTDPKHQLPAGQSFAAWFAATESEQRKKWTRERNTIIALQLLPLFEAEPAGWETLPALMLGARDPQKTLARHLEEWTQHVPTGQRDFVGRIARVFSLKG